MAVFKFASGDYSVDLSGGGTGLGGPGFEPSYEKHTSTVFGIYEDSKNYIAFGGANLRYVLKSGQVQDVVGGTITSLKFMYQGEAMMQVTGLNLSASKFFDAVIKGNNQTVFDFLLSGNDTVHGTANNDVILGGKGDDLLKGNAGNDRIGGQLGADDLYGGAGKDVFVFKSLKDSTVSKAGRDTIFDFDGGKGDRIDLSAIDANSKTNKNESFAFIGSKDFSGKGAELRYEKKASDTYIYGDVNGDKKADFAIHLDDAVTMQKGYFVL